jgi:serine/alanine adding enzyme
MLLFYDRETIKKTSITFPDIYYTPEYGEAIEYSDNGIWECCVFKDLIYVYIKRPVKFNNNIYYDLITPYGYSGYYYKKIETFNEFIPLFRKEAKDKNFVVEVVRQNPYLDANIEISNYKLLKTQDVYGIQIDNFDNFFKKVLPSKKRNMYNKGIKNNFSFELIKLSEKILDTKFREIYESTMDKLKASKYYYFNDMYYRSLEKINDIYLALAYNKDNILIGSIIIFKYNNYLHYHLSGNDNSSNCISDYILINVVKEIGENKIFILGGGGNSESLSRFKRKLSNISFKYNIYKNIINNEIYEKLLDKKLVI